MATNLQEFLREKSRFFFYYLANFYIFEDYLQCLFQNHSYYKNGLQACVIFLCGLQVPQTFQNSSCIDNNQKDCPVFILLSVFYCASYLDGPSEQSWFDIQIHRIIFVKHVIT